MNVSGKKWAFQVEKKNMTIDLEMGKHKSVSRDNT